MVMGDKQPPSKIGRPLRISGEKPTKEKIFDEALDLFAEQGYDRTSVRRIAEAVGLTESAVYRHYFGKEAILDAIFSYAGNQVFSPLPDAPDGGSALSIFRRLLIVPLDVILADSYLIKIMRVMYAEMHHNEKIRRYYKEEYVERADDLLEALFKEQIAKGSIQDCDARGLAMVFNAFRSEWAFRNFILEHESPIDIGRIKKDLEEPIRFFEKTFLTDEDV